MSDSMERLEAIIYTSAVRAEDWEITLKELRELLEESREYPSHLQRPLVYEATVAAFWQSIGLDAELWQRLEDLYETIGAAGRREVWSSLLSSGEVISLPARPTIHPSQTAACGEG